MKKPLKNILASLATPEPSIQVLEEAEDETAAKIIESDEEFGVTSTSNRRSDWDAQDDARYKGKSTSRKKFADSDDEGEDDDGIDEQDGVEEESSSEEENDVKEKTEDAVSSSLEARYDVFSSDESDESDEDESGGDDEDGEDMEEDDQEEASDEEPEELPVKLKRPAKPAKNVRFHEEDDEVGSDGEENAEEDDDEDDSDDEEDHFASLEDEDSSGPATKVFSEKQSQSSEVEKGVAVKHQLEEWDAFLQWRIHLQKLLHSSNQTPDWRTYPEFVESSDKDFGQAMTKAKKSVKQLLVAIINAREARATLSASNKSKKPAVEDEDEEIPSDDEDIPSSEASGDNQGSDEESLSPSKKAKTTKNGVVAVARANQSLEQLEEIRRSGFAKSKAYREGVIQEWSDKTRLMSRTTKADKGFAAFDQSTLQQIQHIMADRQRLLKRTRTQRSSYQILGKRKAPSDDVMVVPDGTQENEESNPEIFDDDDFYQNLLREFIEKRISTEGNANLVGQHWLEMQNLRKKLKKQRLDRESKDRRIKYEVHQKMVSFMAPKLPPMDSLNDEARNELFSCLFGKNSMREAAIVAENGEAEKE